MTKRVPRHTDDLDDKIESANQYSALWMTTVNQCRHAESALAIAERDGADPELIEALKSVAEKTYAIERHARTQMLVARRHVERLSRPRVCVVPRRPMRTLRARSSRRARTVARVARKATATGDPDPEPRRRRLRRGAP